MGRARNVMTAGCNAKSQRGHPEETTNIDSSAKIKSFLQEVLTDDHKVEEMIMQHHNVGLSLEEASKQLQMAIQNQRVALGGNYKPSRIGRNWSGGISIDGRR